MTPCQHLSPVPHVHANPLYVSLWLIGLEVGHDPRLALPAWLSKCAETILVLFKPFAQA